MPSTRFFVVYPPPPRARTPLHPVTLAVAGVEGLWVADCSVAPTPVSGGAAAIALLVGERAAAALLRSHHN